MSVSVTFTADTAEQIRSEMFDFLGEQQTELPRTESNEAPAARRGRKPKAGAPAAPSVQTQAAPLPPSVAPAAPANAPLAPAPIPVAGPPFPAPSTEGAVPATGITYDQVFAQIKAYNDKHGMEKARALLVEFGVGMVRQLKPEQYAQVMQKFAV